MAVINVPHILREKLSDEGVDALVELLNSAEERIKEAVVSLCEERFERRLVEAISALRVTIEERIAHLEARIDNLEARVSGLEAKIASVKSDLEVKIANVHADIIRWMFIFWAGQIGALIGILLVFFKK
jgi:polyhydroxyalkanoate synthesis regulator phasin